MLTLFCDMLMLQSLSLWQNAHVVTLLRLDIFNWDYNDTVTACYEKWLLSLRF